MANESSGSKFFRSLSSLASKSVSQTNLNDRTTSKGLRSFFRKSRSEAPTRSTSPLPSAASAEHSSRAVSSPFETAQDEQEQSSEIQDQINSQTVPGPAAAVTLSSGHGPPETLTQVGPTIVISDHQGAGLTQDAASGTNVHSTLAPSKPVFKTKDTLKVTGRFIQTLLKKLPDVADGNPVKIALGLAKMIVEIKQGVEDNMDTVERRIVSVAAQLDMVAKAVEGWRPNSEGSKSINRFQTTLEAQFRKLQELSKEWTIKKIADFENEKSQIAEIFENVNEARIQLQVETGLQVSKIVHSIEESLK
ncbi:hypothetical protein H0H93_001943, partial [Arthromyces matolae]